MKIGKRAWIGLMLVTASVIAVPLASVANVGIVPSVLWSTAVTQTAMTRRVVIQPTQTYGGIKIIGTNTLNKDGIRVSGQTNFYKTGQFSVIRHASGFIITPDGARVEFRENADSIALRGTFKIATDSAGNKSLVLSTSATGGAVITEVTLFGDRVQETNQ